MCIYHHPILLSKPWVFNRGPQPLWGALELLQGGQLVKENCYVDLRCKDKGRLRVAQKGFSNIARGVNSAE